MLFRETPACPSCSLSEPLLGLLAQEAAFAVGAGDTDVEAAVASTAMSDECAEMMGSTNPSAIAHRARE